MPVTRAILRRSRSGPRPAGRVTVRRAGAVILTTGRARRAPRLLTERMSHHERPRYVPVSTYRLQVHGGFPLTAARDVVPYLARLGVGAVYTSPYFAAAPGSTHGYDVCNHNEINPELGGAAAHDGVRRGGARRTGSCTSSTSCRTTWASAPAPTRGGTTCSRTDRARRPRGSSTSTGRRSRRSCTPSCCCRSSAISTARCSSAASCSWSSATARSDCATSTTSCRSTRARRRASTARPSSR